MKYFRLFHIFTATFFAILYMGMPSHLSAQAQITDNVSLEMLVNEVLLGGNLNATNITFNGVAAESVESNQFGSFEIVNSAFPFAQGAILATASVTHFTGGPPLQTENLQDDPDLITLTGAGQWGNEFFNCAILEFDIVAVSDALLIDYAFASNEYLAYTCSSYNDVFGLFVSGPGISGPFLNNATNIAVIPGTTIPISVNSVNSGQASIIFDDYDCVDINPNYQADSIYFINNYPPLVNSITAQGHTHLLTATTTLIPESVYHVKFAVANARNPGNQSAVFIRKGSVSSESGLNLLEISADPNNIEIAPEGLFIAGTFNYFIPEPMDLTGDGIYTFEAQVPADVNVTYKFYNGNGPDAQELVDEECGISGAMSDLSRYVLMPDEPMVLETVCFGACDAQCSGVSSTRIVDKNQFAIYPNPGRGAVQVILPGTRSQQVYVQIFDLTGKRVMEKNINSLSGESILLDISSLHKGLYMVQLTSESQTFVTKLVKE